MWIHTKRKLFTKPVDSVDHDDDDVDNVEIVFFLLLVKRTKLFDWLRNYTIILS